MADPRHFSYATQMCPQVGQRRNRLAANGPTSGKHKCDNPKHAPNEGTQLELLAAGAPSTEPAGRTETVQTGGIYARGLTSGPAGRVPHDGPQMSGEGAHAFQPAPQTRDPLATGTSAIRLSPLRVYPNLENAGFNNDQEFDLLAFIVLQVGAGTAGATLTVDDIMFHLHSGMVMVSCRVSVLGPTTRFGHVDVFLALEQPGARSYNRPASGRELLPNTLEALAPLAAAYIEAITGGPHVGCQQLSLLDRYLRPTF